MSIIMENLDLHMSNQIFYLLSVFRSRCRIIHSVYISVFEMTVWNFNTWKVFNAGDWIYGQIMSSYLTIVTRGEKFRKQRNIIETSASNIWKLILLALRVKKIRRWNWEDFRFTLYRKRHLMLANPASFHGWSTRYIFKAIPNIFEE